MNPTTAQHPAVHGHAWAYPLWFLAVLVNAGQPFVIGLKSSFAWPGYVWLGSTFLIALGALTRLFARRLFPQHVGCVREALAPTAFGLKLVLAVLVAVAIVFLVAAASSKNLL
jgi:hypothetical protein